MLEKKKFSKKINYDAIKNLFASGDSDAGSTYGGDDDDDADAPLIGQTYSRKDKRSRSRVGTPIVTPEPTWRQGSRAPSEAPSVGGRSALGREVANAAHHDEGEEEDHEPEQREEDDEGWRSQFATQADGDDEVFGYDEV